jgi:hypothetical protein
MNVFTNELERLVEEQISKEQMAIYDKEGYVDPVDEHARVNERLEAMARKFFIIMNES